MNFFALTNAYEHTGDQLYLPPQACGHALAHYLHYAVLYAIFLSYTRAGPNELTALLEIRA